MNTNRFFERQRSKRIPPASMLAILCFSFCCCAAVESKTTLTSPKQFYGFNIGDDYKLTNYTNTEEYLKKLSDESDRLKLVNIGKTEEGRDQYMVIASSPENLANLEHYREISEKLARGRISLNEAKRLASEGKAIVWIDGGLHATETVGAHQLIETIWQLAKRNDEETNRILNNTIILLVHANPDGHELVGNWYMRRENPVDRVLDPPPTLYNKYAGHDNNRDAYMNALKETTNMSRVLYLQWYPQIMYNHHQTSPTGTVIAIPPFRNPPNYHVHPSVMMGIEAVGAAMNQRYLSEGKGGVVSRGGTMYSAWWNGGQRTTPYFHNMIGLLTEITGNPTPSEIGFVPDRQIPSTDLPLPISPQPWHFRQSIDYSITANWAVLNYASLHREDLLISSFKMASDEINWGGHDSWTFNPDVLDKVKQAAAGASAGRNSGSDSNMAKYFVKPIDKSYWAELRRPGDRNPRAYIIPSDQKDFNRAIAFVNSLIKSGIEVERADKEFLVADKKYPDGSLIVRTDQAYRAHVLDMFEPQHHPQDFEYAGGPPIPPYDSAGWTLAYQMGVEFDRILDAPPSHFNKIPLGQLQTPPPGKVIDGEGSCYSWSGAINDSFKLANVLLKNGIGVARASIDSKEVESGDFIVKSEAKVELQKNVSSIGVNAKAIACPNDQMPLKRARIALIDRYGGSMPSGWNRKILEDFGFDYTVVYPKQIKADILKNRYDVVIVPADMAIPKPGEFLGEQDRFLSPKIDPNSIPAKYRERLGRLDANSAAELRNFIENGGIVVAENMAAPLAYYLDDGITNHLVKKTNKERENLTAKDFYIPGSLVQADVDRGTSITWGMPSKIDIYYADTRFSQSSVFDLKPGGISRPILWFSSFRPLRSGWAWGQNYLKDGVSAVEIKKGKGKAYIYGTDITFRYQMQGGFKLLFNALYGN